MANTYAINTTRGREFEVEAELQVLGLHPIVARRLDSKKITQSKDRVWFDTPYVPKLLFCAFPAVYWGDVTGIKHIIGKPVRLSRGDIEGRPSCDIQRVDGTKRHVPAVWGLNDFMNAVADEYAAAERRRDSNLFQCDYVPGQHLEMLSGPFAGLPARFQKVLKSAHREYATLRVEIEMMGGNIPAEALPDQVAALS